MTVERRFRTIALALILLLALVWRLNNIGFGLPSMCDPDEPICMLIPINMRTYGTLNPGWFGHPGSTTIYLVTLIDASVAGFGILSGRYRDAAAFAHAAFADPAMLFIPARIAMALIGVGTVWLTYKVGRALGGSFVGLVAALLLAINPLHIAWSQVIRTDINASIFMLASLLFSIRAEARGKLSDYLLAGAFAGFATVTKWPAVTVFLGVAGAAASRGLGRDELQKLGAAFAAMIGGMFVASPFIFIDWRTVLTHVSGEATPNHLGHTGAGFLSNLRFYLVAQTGGSMGWLGLGAVLIGMGLLAANSRPARWILILSSAAFLALICTQHVIWSRWVLPLLPAFCIFAAVAVEAFGRMVLRALPRAPGALVMATATIGLAIPSVAGAFAQARERANDTRGEAARWAIEHIPPGSTVVLEHLELSLRHQPWTILFPVGNAGCIDGLKALGAGVKYRQVQQMRGSSPIADLGNVRADRIDTCRADFAILSYYDLYRTEAGQFPRELGTYDKILAGAKTVALFAPERGQVGGPVVRIVALPQH